MSWGRRDILRLMGIGVGGALARPAGTWAERVRILGGGGGPEAPMALGQVSPGFQRFVREIRVGESRAHGGLLVFWLFGKAAVAPLEVATLEEARSRGDLLISERDQATVPDLAVENRGKAFVLLLAGEILLGGKQNRVLKEDVLLPPISGPRNLGVYCVEQGRWAGRSKDFEAKGTFAAPALRSRLMEKADQGKVWAEVDRSARALAAPSPTRSYQEVYERPEVQDHLKDVEAGIGPKTAPGAFGAAVFVGEVLAGIDVFQDPGLFAREWEKLLRAHALEAYRRPSPSGWEEAKRRARAREILASAAKTEGTLRGNAGVGVLFEFRLEGLRGSALTFEGHVLHTAIL
jgi:ARG/rhodanese/phosphatase superfamily protein